MKFETTHRTIEFSVEKCETYTVTRVPRMITEWCDQCSREVEMLKPEAAARITGLSTRKIYSEIEGGGAHFTESADGLLMVCLRSIGKASTGPQLIVGEIEKS